ncbi:MAG: hypothetical protein MUC95_01945 [Spirochaetes bacterium]|nr:hypothetical protein [Spirochaetota bacterium]
MKKYLQSIEIVIFTLALTQFAYGRFKTPLPVHYPAEQETGSRPYIIWQDIYNERDAGSQIRYRITISQKNKNMEPVLFYPDIYYRHFCVFQYPLNLNDGDYEYKVDRLINNNPDGSRHFHFSKYPITGEFQVRHNQTNDIHGLPPEYLIKYLFIERHNRYINKYNSLFFGTGGAATLGIGILFLKVFDFGVISTVVYAVSFSASAMGFSASGYYGYKYLKKDSELREIVRLGKDVSIKGSAAAGKINTGVELSF